MTRDEVLTQARQVLDRANHAASMAPGTAAALAEVGKGLVILAAELRLGGNVNDR